MNRTVGMRMLTSTSDCPAVRIGSNCPELNKFLRRKTKNLLRQLLSFRKNLKITKERFGGRKVITSGINSHRTQVRDIEHGTIPHPKQHKEVLRAVGAGIKGGVVGTWNKPKEFAHLIRNKFGSADNIPTSLGSGMGEEVEGGRAGHPSHNNPGHKR